MESIIACYALASHRLAFVCLTCVHNVSLCYSSLEFHSQNICENELHTSSKIILHFTISIEKLFRHLLFDNNFNMKGAEKGFSDSFLPINCVGGYWMWKVEQVRTVYIPYAYSFWLMEYSLESLELTAEFLKNLFDLKSESSSSLMATSTDFVFGILLYSYLPYCAMFSLFLLHISSVYPYIRMTQTRKCFHKSELLISFEEKLLRIIYNLFNLPSEHDKAFCVTNKTWIFSWDAPESGQLFIWCMIWRKIDRRRFKLNSVSFRSVMLNYWRRPIDAKLNKLSSRCLSSLHRIHAKNIPSPDSAALIHWCKPRLSI